MRAVELTKLKKIAIKRFYSHKKRNKILGKKPPKKEDFIKLLIENYDNGFKCCYCDKKLVLKDISPYKNVPSIDHKIPLTSGGESEKENLAVCCASCNIIKGTTTAKTFLKIMNYIKHDKALLEDWYSEAYEGRFANKLERLDDDKKWETK